MVPFPGHLQYLRAVSVVVTRVGVQERGDQFDDHAPDETGDVSLCNAKVQPLDVGSTSVGQDDHREPIVRVPRDDGRGPRGTAGMMYVPVPVHVLQEPTEPVAEGRAVFELDSRPHRLLTGWREQAV